MRAKVLIWANWILANISANWKWSAFNPALRLYWSLTTSLKKMTKKIHFSKIILIIIFITLSISCGSNIKTLRKDFVFEKGNEKITFEILNETQVLSLNKANRTKFTFYNVDKTKVNLAGQTIRILPESQTSENETFIEMSPKPENLIDGKLSVIVSYKNEGEMRIFKLLIPTEN